jgi:hypothetical protein
VWSNGYVVPIEKTMLQGSKIYAAIAGQDLTVPVKGQDAIWHFVFKACEQNPEPKFKAKQLELAVVINYKLFTELELRREKLSEDSDTGLDIPTKVSEYNLVLLCITHYIFNRPLVMS